MSARGWRITQDGGGAARDVDAAWGQDATAERIVVLWICAALDGQGYPWVLDRVARALLAA